MGLLILDQPKINSHEIFGDLLMSTFTSTIITVNFFGFHFLSPIDGFLVHFSFINKLVMSFGNELKHFRILATIFEQHLKSLDRQFQMLEDFSWIFVSYVLFAEVDSNQIRDDCVVLSADEIQTDID